MLKAEQVDHCSSVYSVVKVLWKENAFSRLSVTDSCWNK